MKTIIKNWLKHLLRLAKPEIKADEMPLNIVQIPKQKTKIGDNCYIHNCSIGDYTYLSKNVSIMNTSIGKFCSIGQGVNICLGRHPSSTFVSTHPAFFSTNKQNGMTFADQEYFSEMGSTIIGNDVWIGSDAIILDDITIGDGAIIGAGAVVTKNVPPYAIVVGVPAKTIKYRFSQAEILFLENFKWWNKSEEWLQANYKDMHDIKKFISKFSSYNN